MKKLLLVSACLLALSSSPVLAQAGGPNVVVVQLYHTGLSTGHIAITRGEGKTEDIEYKDQDTKEHTSAIAYQRVLAQLYQEGYTLKSTFTPGASYVVTLLFEKRQ
ncbi:MAG: hypothetical protein ACRYG7_50220 [Janthinobacterium lividum]